MHASAIGHTRRPACLCTVVQGIAESHQEDIELGKSLRDDDASVCFQIFAIVYSELASQALALMGRPRTKRKQPSTSLRRNFRHTNPATKHEIVHMIFPANAGRDDLLARRIAFVIAAVVATLTFALVMRIVVSPPHTSLTNDDCSRPWLGADTLARWTAFAETARGAASPPVKPSSVSFMYEHAGGSPAWLKR